MDTGSREEISLSFDTVTRESINVPGSESGVR